MSSPLVAALRRCLPGPDAADAAHAPAFGQAAALLLGEATLVIGGAPHRLTEVEFYWTSPVHPDPFTHGDPLQERFGRWYLHRQGASYRGGTYKGLDVAIGAVGRPGGVLIRGVADDAGARRIEGPSAVVDYILARTGAASVAALAAAVEGSIEERGSPLALVPAGEGASERPIVASPRVGLTLRRGADPLRCRYLGRPYRFLVEPERVTKGRVQLFIGLYREGRDAAGIAAITGASGGAVARAIAGFEAGRGRDPAGYRGELGARGLAEALGAVAEG